MRTTKEMIVRKRRQRKSRFFVTGATGFLGSHLVAELLAHGYPVTVLARPQRGLCAKKRMEQLLDWLGTSTTARSSLKVIEGCVEKTDLGLNPMEYASLCEHIDEIIHCASDTSFSERKRSIVERTNIGGVESLLDLAASGRCYFFHYLSTAYVAGKRTGVCKEELFEVGAFSNVYEETKHHAEAIAAKRCNREGLRLSIYRPSIVYGNGSTGRSIGFKAVYYPVRVLLFLKNLFEKDLRESGGRMAGEMGVRRTEDGKLYLPIRIEVARKGGINLIPVNFFVLTFMEIMEECLDGGIFHIINERTKRIEDLIEYVKRLFKINGIESCQTEEFNGRPQNALEILFDGYLGIYGPYMRDTRTFDNENTRAILSGKGLSCPEFDYGIFSRCMNYAMECAWGAKIFEDKHSPLVRDQMKLP